MTQFTQKPVDPDISAKIANLQSQQIGTSTSPISSLDNIPAGTSGTVYLDSTIRPGTVSNYNYICYGYGGAKTVIISYVTTSSTAWINTSPSAGTWRGWKQIVYTDNIENLLTRATDSCTAATGITLNRANVERFGKVCVLHGIATISNTLAGNEANVLTIPVGFRPSNSLYIYLYSTYNGNPGYNRFYLSSDGTLSTSAGSLTFSGVIAFEITYII